MSSFPISALLVLSVLATGSAARAQTVDSSGGSKPADARAGAPAPLIVRFDVGSSELRARDKATLDRASRAYNEGKPIVMVVTGMSDRVGGARANLALSQRRAEAVLRGLLDRGIPAERFQVLAKGETELPIATKQGVAEPENRRVEITWR